MDPRTYLPLGSLAAQQIAISIQKTKLPLLSPYKWFFFFNARFYTWIQRILISNIVNLPTAPVKLVMQICNRLYIFVLFWFEDK